MKKTNLPPVIQAIINLFAHGLPKAIERLYWDENPRIRAVRSDTKENLCKLFDFLIRHFDVESNMIIRKINGSIYVPVTVEYCAKAIGVCTRTIERLFEFLIKNGLLTVHPQRRVIIKGECADTLIAHACSRYLSPKLFEICGILYLLLESKKNKPMDGIFVRASYAKRRLAHKADSSPAGNLPKKSFMACREERLQGLQKLGFSDYMLELAKRSGR